MRRQKEMQINRTILKVRKAVRRGLLELLETLQSEKVDNIEEVLIARGLTLVAEQYLGKPIPEAATTAAAKEIVKCLNRINSKLQNQLKEQS